MIPATHSAHSVATTAESLRDELLRLEIQKQSLERELAAVVAHLGSVQQALGALRVVMDDARTAPSGATAEPGPVDEGAPVAPLVSQKGPATPRPGTTAATPVTPAPRRKSARRGAVTASSPGSVPESAAASSPASADTDGSSAYGKITDQILEYFAGIGDADVRARDVAAALGRDTGNGSINAVRSTLDRLVGTSRLQRAGRGLYRANRS